MAMEKAFILEDSQVEVMILEAYLMRMGFQICGKAGNSREFFELFEPDFCDFVLVNIVLEDGESGLDIGKYLAEKKIPFLFVSSSSDQETFEKIKNFQPLGFIVKPYNYQQTYIMIDLAIQNARLKDQAEFYQNSYKDIINNIPGMICRYDADFKITYVNRNYCNYFQKNEEELIGTSWLSLLEEDEAERSKDLFLERDCRTTERYKIEINNEYRWLEWTHHCILDSYGQPTEYQSIGFDITEKLRNEKNLEKAKSDMESLLKAIPSIIVGVSVKDRITHFNEYSEKFFGFSREAALGKIIAELPVRWNWVDIYEGITESIISQRPYTMNDFVYEQDGEDGYMDITITPVMDDDAILQGFLIHGADRTSEKKLQMQLSTAQKLESIGQLAAGIAHEINSPMQYISDNLNFLKQSVKSIISMVNSMRETFIAEAEVTRELNLALEKVDYDFMESEIDSVFTDMEEGIGRITSIIKSMKTLSHPGTDQKIPVNINKCLDDTVNISRNEWKYMSTIIREYDPNLGPVMAYSNELNQVFLNLIINSAQANSEKYGDAEKDPGQEKPGRITLKTMQTDALVRIVIEDNGLGISTENIKKIFNPFFTTKEPGKGTGQGLSIAHTVIVKKHQGTIEVTSTPGVGTSVNISLPRD